MSVLDTSIPTSQYTQNENDLIIVIIKTEEIKQYVKKRYTLRQNIIRIYGLWVQF